MVIPNPANVSEPVLITGTISPPPPSSPYYQGITIRITKPDASTFNLGPFTSDSSGSVSTYFTPDIMGTYNVNITYPGGYFNGGYDWYTPSSKTISFIAAYFESPVASFTISPSSPEAGETITFDASGSHDPDGSISSYHWQFSRPITGEILFTFSSYSSILTQSLTVGDYNVTLTVTDNDLFTDSTSQLLTVIPPVVQYHLTISIIGSGNVEPGIGDYLKDAGMTVTVFAYPAFGWVLDYWLLDGTDVGPGDADSYEVTMNTDHTLTAVFKQIYGLTINVVGFGTTNPEPGEYVADAGISVDVSATAYSGWLFSHWQLDGTNVSFTNTYTVTMNQNHILTAVFVEETDIQEYNLTISVVGSGTTDPEPGEYVADSGTSIEVNATAYSGWLFSHWELDGVNASFTNTYTVTMDQSHALTAVFVPEETSILYNLTISVVGSGSTDPTAGDYVADAGLSVTVTATANSSWLFSHWQLDGTNVSFTNTYTVTMNQNHILTAVFVEETDIQEYNLTISVVGSGTTNPVAGGYVADAGVSVTVTATANSGWHFDYWLLNGVYAGAASSCAVAMNQNQVLTAVFAQDSGQNQGNSQGNTQEPETSVQEYELTISVVGSGTTDPEPGEYVADAGTSVTVTAYPDEGYEFDYWLFDGANVSSATSYSFKMNKAHVLTAVFRAAGSLNGDTTPPVIGSHNINPEEPNKDTDATIGFYVADEDSEVESVTLVYSISGGEWQQAPMVFGGEVWSATIPKQAEGVHVDFYVGSYDTQGNYAESDIFSYDVKSGGIQLWVIVAAVGGIAGVTAGVTVFLAKTGHIVLGSDKQTAELQKDNESSERKRQRRKKEKPKLEWTLVSPSTIRSGGFAYAYGEIRNVGEVRATKVEIAVKGPPELKMNPPIKIGDINKNARKDFRIKLECGSEASPEKKGIMYSLSINGDQAHTIVRAVSFRALRVGVLDDAHHLAYIKKAGFTSSQFKQLSSWLTASKFTFERVTEAENFEALLNFDVIIASSQLALSDKDVANLKRYVEGGRGLVAMDGVGTINADAYLRGEVSIAGESRVYNLFGYGRPEVANIEKGLKGIRITQNIHAVTGMYKKEAMINLPSQSGIAFKSAVSTSKMLADQRVSLDRKSGFVSLCAVSAGKYGKGRVVHFNFNAEVLVGMISLLVDQALVWTAGYE
jgi:riboflavin synthase alpha subunit